LFAERSGELAASGEPLVCYEVPLLFEGRLAESLRPVVVVTASVDDQVRRTVARDSTTESDALARIRAQMPLADKAQKADYVIGNSGLLETTLARADHVLDAVCGHFGIDPARYAKP
jgi:dephospho-CoA kinase